MAARNNFKSIQLYLFASSVLVWIGCAGTGGSGLSGNDGGSSPNNAKEEISYKKALLKCYKTGGHRVVKIEGRLRCY